MANNNDKNNKFFFAVFVAHSIQHAYVDNEHKVSDGRETKKKKKMTNKGESIVKTIKSCDVIWNCPLAATG